MDYNKILSNVVLPKLKEFGKSTTLKKKTITSGDWIKEYDPVSMGYVWKNTETGEVSDTEPTATEVYTEYNVDMLVDTFKNKEIDGTLVKAGDIKIYAIPTIEINVDDIVIVNNKDMIVYHLEKIQPSSLLLMYVLYVRNVNARIQGH
ncbi:MAG TPA: hypothetical protein VFC79_00530 [Tissierellaceae bacterium]|nr:hypothetical protein [Tissierellaceae bacterium]